MPELTALFAVQPKQWGVRGDLYLWREMLETLANEAWPRSESELVALLQSTFARLVGPFPADA
jgi:hypothetical protein